MEIVTKQTPMREIEIFGIPALFTDAEIPESQQLPGLFCYELVSTDNSSRLLGSILTLNPVDLPETGERDVYDTDLNLDTEGEMLTPEEFGEKYLSPEYDPDPEERYGKDE